MKKFFPLLLLCMFLLPADPVPPDNFELRESDRKSLERGELVVRQVKIGSTPWPEITVFSTIDADPLQSCGVFYAYHEHKAFLPDLLSSIPVKYISPTDLHIKFEMKVPWPLRNSRYTTGNIFSRYGDGGFRIKWYHVSSTASKDTRGTVIFLPFKKKTLFIYKTFIHPKSRLAGLFKKRMIKEVLRSVRAIISRIESVIKKNPEKMAGYIHAVNLTLAGKYVYQDIQGAGK